MGKHFHVLIGMEGGYMPDSNYYTTTLREAEEIAKSEADFYRDDYQVERVGRATPAVGVRYLLTPTDADGTVRDGATTLRNYIEIASCSEADCRSDDEGGGKRRHVGKGVAVTGYQRHWPDVKPPAPSSRPQRATVTRTEPASARVKRIKQTMREVK